MRTTTALRTIPAVLSSLVLGAHFLRGGHLAVAVAVATAPLLLLWRNRWSVRVVQALLAAGVVVWLHTLVVLSALRRAEGLPYSRMAAILIAVAAVTGLAAWLLEGSASPPGDAALRPEDS